MARKLSPSLDCGHGYRQFVYLSANLVTNINPNIILILLYSAFFGEVRRCKSWYCIHI